MSSTITGRHGRSFVLYLLAGGIATASHYAVTIAAVELAGIRAVLASALGFLAGAAVKYVLNYFLAFRSSERHHAAVPRFAAALAALFAGNVAIFWVLHDAVHLHYLVAQVLTTGLLVPIGYLVSRNWVFRGC